MIKGLLIIIAAVPFVLFTFIPHKVLATLKEKDQRHGEFICADIIGKYEVQRNWLDHRDCIIPKSGERYFVDLPEDVDSVYYYKVKCRKLFDFISTGKPDKYGIISKPTLPKIYQCIEYDQIIN